MGARVSNKDPVFQISGVRVSIAYCFFISQTCRFRDGQSLLEHTPLAEVANLHHRAYTEPLLPLLFSPFLLLGPRYLRMRTSKTTTYGGKFRKSLHMLRKRHSLRQDLRST